MNGLKGKKLGDELLLPSIMLKHGESTFLDDISVEEVSKTLHIKIKIVFGADDFVRKVMEVNPHSN